MYFVFDLFFCSFSFVACWKCRCLNSSLTVVVCIQCIFIFYFISLILIRTYSIDLCCALAKKALLCSMYLLYENISQVSLRIEYHHLPRTQNTCKLSIQKHSFIFQRKRKIFTQQKNHQIRSYFFPLDKYYSDIIKCIHRREWVFSFCCFHLSLQIHFENASLQTENENIIAFISVIYWFIFVCQL